MTKIGELFNQELKVVNLGIRTFGEDLSKLGVRVVQVAWRPPAGGNQKMISLLSKIKKS